MQLCALGTIHHGLFNNLLNWLHCTLPSKPSRYSQHMLMTLSSTLLATLRRTLSIALHGILPACLTIRSQVSSQDPLWYTPSTLPVYIWVLFQGHSQASCEVHSQLHSIAHSHLAWLYAPKYAVKVLTSTLLSTLSSTLPTALDGTLPAYFALRFQVHSQEARHSRSHLPICSHVFLHTWSRDLQSCRHLAPGEVRQVAGGRWRVVGRQWQVVNGCRRVVGGRWRVLDGGW